MYRLLFRHPIVAARAALPPHVSSMATKQGRTTTRPIARSVSPLLLPAQPTLLLTRNAGSMAFARQTSGQSNNTYSRPTTVAAFVGFTGIIYGMTQYFWNMQRRKNLVMDILMFQIRTNATLKELLGDEIDLSGWKWIYGEINQLKGIVNIKFDVTGSTGAVATIEVKMQRYPHDPTKWQTVDYFVSTKGKSWNGYVDEELGTLQLRGGM